MDDHTAQLPRDSLTLRGDRLRGPGLAFGQKRGPLLHEPPHQPRAAPNQAADQHRCASYEDRIPKEPAQNGNGRVGQQIVNRRGHRDGKQCAHSQFQLAGVGAERVSGQEQRDLGDAHRDPGPEQDLRNPGAGQQQGWDEGPPAPPRKSEQGQSSEDVQFLLPGVWRQPDQDLELGGDRESAGEQPVDRAQPPDAGHRHRLGRGAAFSVLPGDDSERTMKDHQPAGRPPRCPPPTVPTCRLPAGIQEVTSS